jgi:hypothetical protein
MASIVTLLIINLMIIVPEQNWMIYNMEIELMPLQFKYFLMIIIVSNGVLTYLYEMIVV